MFLFPIMMLSLVHNGCVSEERLDVSCARVLEVRKSWLLVFVCEYFVWFCFLCSVLVCI